MAATFDRTWKALAARVDAALDRFLPAENASPRELHRAMRYSVFAGGKRLRPVLCLLSGKMMGERVTALLPPACALEMVHTYSLIHDDLPAMDDDDVRRGKPTSHRVFGEALAILSGDALLTLAFETITRRTKDAGLVAALTHELARAAGSDGMVGGQTFDVLSEGKPPDATLVDEIHRRKTAALIRASVRMGAMTGGASKAELRDLTHFGEAVGLLFQITDDLLDETGDDRRMGKRLRKDAEHGKQTYPRVHGVEESRALAEKLAAKATLALKKYGRRAGMLLAVPTFILSRRK
ncbi:MAG TPA: farnesyl diphosphate synthase [Planctomycetota bacterium]|nr:farnesyl diphosphate synthase [Planctomycetota bacterium]